MTSSVGKRWKKATQTRRSLIFSGQRRSPPSAKTWSDYVEARTLLMMIVSDCSGPDAVAPLIAEVRLNATKLGDRHTTAALHLHVGEMEGRRGMLRSAVRHANLGLDIAHVPNVWLESIAHNLLLALALLGSDFETARERGETAAALAATAGAAGMHRSALGNLGNLFFAIGEYERAVGHFEHALSVLPSGRAEQRRARNASAHQTDSRPSRCL